MSSPTMTVDLTAALKRLRLGRIAESLPERLTLAEKQKLGFEELLLTLLTDEIARRDSSATSLRVSQAHPEPTGARQRHHPRSAARARALRRAGQPRPRDPRDRPRRQRPRLLRRLRPRRERRGGRRHAPQRVRARLAAGPRGLRPQPRPAADLGPDGRLRDDEPQPPRLHVPVSQRQARGLQGPRLLRHLSRRAPGCKGPDP